MTEKRSKRSPFGLAGVVLGIAALGIALAHFLLGPIEPAPSLEDVVADTAVKIKGAVEARLRGERSEGQGTRRDVSADDIVQSATFTSAFLAIVLAVVSFIRREDLRVSGSAAALGAGAIAFEIALLALGVLVVVILVVAVLGALGISP